MSEQQITPVFENNSDEQLILKDLVYRYLRNWKWIALSIVLCVLSGVLYLKNVIPQYKSTAKVLIKEDNKGGMAAGMDIFEDLGLSSGSSNLENEIEIFKSHSLLKKVVVELELNRKIELADDENESSFQKSPFSLNHATNDSLLHDKEIHFQLTVENETEFSLKDEKTGKKQEKLSFGKPFSTPIGKLVIDKTSFYRKENNQNKYSVRVTPIQHVTSSLQQKLNISTVNKDASVLSISLEGPNVEKNNTVISTLIDLHEESAVEDKNQITQTTSNFINERMLVIAQELSSVEVEGQKFKTEKSLTDLTSDAQLFIEKNNELEGAITEVAIQLELAEYMNTYLSEQTTYDMLLPTNLGIQDVSIAATITQYNTNVLERNRLLQSSNENNPVVKKMESQLSGLKKSLVASLNNLRSSLKIKLKKLETEERQNQSKIASIPAFEREYRSIARQQQIKETLYLYLLQKREENQIAMAATIGNVKIIDEPYSDGLPVSPKSKIILLGALLLGILIPIGVMYVKDLLDNKIRSVNDIEALSLPYAGDIPANDTKEEIVVGKGQRSSISEAFRMLRTNMSFMLHKEVEGGKVIAVTSSIKGEGKTFTALNIASSLSLTDKKVLLIGMDLRSPQLTKLLDRNNGKGVTNYLIDKQIGHQELISKSEDNPYLSFMISGPIPPNPSELLHSDRLKELIDAVRLEFDFVVIDTAPMGMVVDTQLITPIVDLTLYVVRANYADKRLMQIPLSLYQANKIKNIAMVLNDIKLKNTRAHYGYGYGYGYGDDFNNKKSFFDRFRK